MFQLYIVRPELDWNPQPSPLEETLLSGVVAGASGVIEPAPQGLHKARHPAGFSVLPGLATFSEQLMRLVNRRLLVYPCFLSFSAFYLLIVSLLEFQSNLV